MGAERVQGERTHRARPAGAKNSILIRCFRPLGLSEHGKILRAQCVLFFGFCPVGDLPFLGVHVPFLGVHRPNIDWTSHYTFYGIFAPKEG